MVFFRPCGAVAYTLRFHRARDPRDRHLLEMAAAAHGSQGNGQDPRQDRPASAGQSRRWRPSWRGSVHYGPEYRVYFVQRGPYTVVLLCDGDKSSQDTDIDRAMRLAKEED